ncbi:MAG: tRNA (adenosine(37)-N6)-dimethylallyltransferase MiaA [Proteobacteria bacterium]|nr:tRNA (adenosine(37)-N6)-dimethylallyltransferase MiaA [Pseudomonadota bacterium]
MPESLEAKPRVVDLAGPTGVGKTRLSLVLARTFGAEIVNADSMQVYRRLDIGTAKPTPDERAEAPHHLIDVVDPDQDFDAARFVGLARPLIADLDRRGGRALVVGGTGLYLRSLLRGLFQGPGRDAGIRSALQAEADRSGPEALYQRLTRVDPETAARIGPADRVRIVRALEVHDLTGRPISRFQEEHQLADNPFEVQFFCLNLPRAELYQRIEERTGRMFDDGLIEEVEGLLNRGYAPDLKPLKAIGYKQAVACLQGRLTVDRARAEIMKQTRRYAKRQLTWFRAQPDVHWVSPDALEAVVRETGGFWGE